MVPRIKPVVAEEASAGECSQDVVNPLFLLFCLPPYFREHEGQPPEDVVARWSGGEMETYRGHLDCYLFPVNVSGFKDFARMNPLYFEDRWDYLLQLPDSHCQKALEMIAQERVKYQAEMMREQKLLH